MSWYQFKARLNWIKTLPYDWDGYSGYMSDIACENAIHMATRLEKLNVILPELGYYGDGEIGFIWNILKGEHQIKTFTSMGFLDDGRLVGTSYGEMPYKKYSEYDEPYNPDMDIDFMKQWSIDNVNEWSTVK